jgi:hypothetical protein
MEKIKSENFAKVFQSPKYGQILVIKDTIDELPAVEVRVYPKGTHISVATKFENTEEGWNSRDWLFDDVDIDVVEAFVGAKIGPLFQEGGELSEHKD